MKKSGEEHSHWTILKLVKSPNMRTKTLILFYNWFVNAFAYFGLSLNMGQLTGGSDVYFNFTMSGLLEIPAYAAALLILKHLGRRAPYFVSMLLCGLSLLSVVLIPRGVFTNDWPVLAVREAVKKYNIFLRDSVP